MWFAKVVDGFLVLLLAGARFSVPPLKVLVAPFTTIVLSFPLGAVTSIVEE